MIGKRIKYILAFILVLELFLLNTSATDADIFAERRIISNRLNVATLSFTQNQTANNYKILELFRTTGFIPGGFEVGSIRIRKEGKLAFHYIMESVKIGAKDDLCQALDLRVMKKNVWIYEGKLIDFSLTSLLDGDKEDDYVFFLHLNETDSRLKNISCEFNFHVRTFRQDVNEKGGLFDEKNVSNIITTGLW